MNWSKLYSGLKNVAALAGIATILGFLLAVLGFLLTVRKDYELRRSEYLQGQLETTILGFIQSAGPEGREVSSSANNDLNDLGRKLFGDSFVSSRNANRSGGEGEIRRALLSLMAKQVILLSPDKKYVVRMQPKYFLSSDSRVLQLSNFEKQVFNEVVQKADQYSAVDLQEKLVKDYGANIMDAYDVIFHLTQPGPWGPPRLVAADGVLPLGDKKLRVRSY